MNAPGAQQNPIYCMIAGALNVSFDNGTTWTSVSGEETITTDATLTGAGTVGSPLGVNPVAARAPDWFGAMEAYFQQQTGISPIAWGSVYRSNFGNTTVPASNNSPGFSQGFLNSGTGSGITYTNLGMGSVIKATAPTSGSGYADWAASGAGTGWSILGNIQTKRWMVAVRVSVGLAPVSATAVSLGVFSSSNYVGLGLTGAVNTWQYSRGTTPTSILDTGKAFTVDGTGATGYLTMCIGNFDLAHIAYNVDIAGSSFSAPTVAEAIANIPNAAANPYFYNEGASSGQVLFYNKILVCAEF